MSRNVYVRVSASGRPWWLERIDGLALAIVAAVGLVATVAGALDVTSSARIGELVFFGAMLIVAVRLVLVGVAVSGSGIRVRRMFVTRRVAWSEIVDIEPRTGPGLWKEWTVLCLVLRSGSCVWLTPMRRPVSSRRGDPVGDADFGDLHRVAEELRKRRAMLGPA